MRGDTEEKGWMRKSWRQETDRASDNPLTLLSAREEDRNGEKDNDRQSEFKIGKMKRGEEGEV